MEALLKPQDKRLQPFIKSYWTLRSGDTGFCTTLPPEPSCHLLFNFADKTIWRNGKSEAVLKHAYVSGVRAKPYTIIPNGDVDYFAVQFYPDAFYPLFGLPMKELTNTPVDIADANIRDCEKIIERLFEANDTYLRITLIEELLIRSLQRNDAHDETKLYYLKAILKAIHATNGQARLADIATGIGIYYKKAERIFNEYLGVTPKFYSRVVRFNHGLTLLEKLPSGNYTDIAYRSGYTDQSHFINEFKHFSGSSPSAIK